MGIFADKCQAIIGSDNKCLSGEALEKAQLEKRPLRCKHSVKKAAKFCSKCGSPAPGGWTKCSSCKKWVGNDSQHCWNCSAALHPQDRTAVADGHWQKPAGMLAKRLDVGDVKDLLHKKKKILVEEGSCAILLQGGKFKDVLNPGEHTLDSLGRKINNWGDPPPSTIVMLDAGDIVVPLRVEDIRSSEDIPIELYTEVIIRMVPNDKAGQAFMTNVMKDARELNYSNFTDILRSEIRQAVIDVCNTSSIEDLFKDPERHLHIENHLETKLKESQERYGFEVVRVASAEFLGKEYEALRATNGEHEIKRRQIEFDQRLREMLTKDRMHEFKTQEDLDAYVIQLAHEKDVSEEHRNQELALLRMVHRQELDKKEAAFAMAMETDKTAHEIGIKINWDDYTRNKLVDDAAAEAEVTKIWIGVREEKERVRLKVLADEMSIYEGKDIQTLIAMLPADKRDALLKYNEQMALKGLSKDEILALSAKDNPEIARLLLEDARAKGHDKEKEWEERKKLMDEQADRLERIMNKSLDSITEATKGDSGGSDINVIK